jgi:outer membrane lipoprotein-sorting protein
MKNLFRFFVLTLAAVFIFGGAAASKASAQNEQFYRVLLNKMSENQKTLKSLRTNIKMEQYNAQLKMIETTRVGTLSYLPASGKDVNFRLDWMKPEKEFISYVNGSYKAYRPRLEVVYKGNGKNAVQKQKGAADAFKFLSMNSAELKQNFAGKYIGGELIADGALSAYKITLTPRTAMDFNSADVWVNEAGMPVQIKISLKNGDWVNYLLFETQRNAKISLKNLDFDIPKNAKVIPV